MRDPSNALGKAYAAALRDKARVLRTPYVLSLEVRTLIAADLEALAAIAETHPEVFGTDLADRLAQKDGKGD